MEAVRLALVQLAVLHMSALETHSLILALVVLGSSHSLDQLL